MRRRDIPGADGARVAQAPPDVSDESLARYIEGRLQGEPHAELERVLDGDSAMLELVAVSMRGEQPQGSVLHPGSWLGRYRIEGKLRSGGMGVVYRGHDPSLSRPVAIKVCRAGVGVEAKEEATRLASVKHPNVVTLYEVGEQGELLFLVMELLAGSDLRSAFAADPPSWRAVVDVFIQILRAVEHLHANKVLHRDIKPDNVVLEQLESGELRAVLIDFGLASIEGGELPLSGTRSYMAPELLEGGTPSRASDQYALGVSLLEVLTGQRGDVVWSEGTDDRPPRRLFAIARKASADDPDRRFASIAEMRLALRRLRHRSAITRMGAVVALGACLGLGGLLALAASDRPPASPSCVAAVSAVEHQTKAEIERVRVHYDRAGLNAPGAQVVDELDRRNSEIASSLRSGCEGSSTPAAYDGCARVRHTELRAFATELADADDDTLSIGVQSIRRFPVVESCRYGADPSPRHEVYEQLVRAHLASYANEVDEYRAALSQAEELAADSPMAMLAVSYERSLKWTDPAKAVEMMEDGEVEAERLGADHLRLQFMVARVQYVGYRLGDAEASRKLAERARALLERTPDVRLASDLEFFLGWIEFRHGSHDAAEQHFRESMALARSTGDTFRLGQAAQGLGAVLTLGGRRSEGLEHLFEAREALSSVLAPGSPSLLGVRNGLAVGLAGLGHDREAVEIMTENLDSLEKQYGEDDPVLVDALVSRAWTLLDLQRYEEAEADARRALALLGEPRDEGARRSIGSIQYDLARALARGRHAPPQPDEVDDLLRSALQHVGEKQPIKGYLDVLVAHRLADREDLPAARAVARRALSEQQTALGPDSRLLARARFAVATLEEDDAQFRAATATAGSSECSWMQLSYSKFLAGRDPDAAFFRARWALECATLADSGRSSRVEAREWLGQLVRSRQP